MAARAAGESPRSAPNRASTRNRAYPAAGHVLERRRRKKRDAITPRVATRPGARLAPPFFHGGSRLSRTRPDLGGNRAKSSKAGFRTPPGRSGGRALESRRGGGELEGPARTAGADPAQSSSAVGRETGEGARRRSYRGGGGSCGGVHGQGKRWNPVGTVRRVVLCGAGSGVLLMGVPE